MGYDGLIGKEARCFLYEKIDSIFNDKNISDGEKIKKFTNIIMSLSYGIIEQLNFDFLLGIDGVQADSRVYKLISTVFTDSKYVLDVLENKEPSPLENIIAEEEINVINKLQNRQEIVNTHLNNKLKARGYKFNDEIPLEIYKEVHEEIKNNYFLGDEDIVINHI